MNAVCFCSFIWIAIQQTLFGLLMGDDTMTLYSDSKNYSCHIFCFFQNFPIFCQGTISSVLKFLFPQSFAAEFILVGAKLLTIVRFATLTQQFSLRSISQFEQSRLSVHLFIFCFPNDVRGNELRQSSAVQVLLQSLLCNNNHFCQIFFSETRIKDSLWLLSRKTRYAFDLIVLVCITKIWEEVVIALQHSQFRKLDLGKVTAISSMCSIPVFTSSAPYIWSLIWANHLNNLLFHFARV